MVQSITILGGHGRLGLPDLVDRIELAMGDVVSIVGPTGSGKTTFINDIELFADPRIALHSDSRIVMKEGRVADFLTTNPEERAFSVRVGRLDDAMARLRDQLRHGYRLAGTELDGLQ
jgi:ABC-type histidine transport system ATPase subunit